MTATETALDRCVVCQGARWRPYWRGLLECTSCGHLFADLKLGKEELFELYQEGYFRGDEYSDYAADKRTIQENARLRWKVLRRFIDRKQHRRLFEVGCAYGFFLDVVRSEFESVSGIDVSRAALQHARNELGLDVIEGDLASIDLGGRQFDVVCMWDCIEHLRDPDRYVQRLARRMAPGALLAVTTGDIRSLNARLRGRHWRLIHPPTHVHYFSKVTLVQMFERYGFSVRYARYCGFYRSLDGVAHGLLSLGRGKSRLHGAVENSRLARLDFYLNLYDIVYAIFEKTR
jgi:SAM-dependent methyltransferase